MRFSNAFGTTLLNVSAVTVARPFNNSAGTSIIQQGALQAVAFNKGEAGGLSIPPGSLAVSDPFPHDSTGITTYTSNGTTEAGSILTVTMYLAEGQQGEAITSHPGRRTTTYLSHGNQVSTTNTNTTGSEIQSLAHWYFISAVEIWAPTPASTFVIIGDSITDGRGSDTNLNDRWPDLLFTRLQSSQSALTNAISIANQAAGGNRILADGLGPSVLSRLDRDVLAQSGVRYAMIFEGVNDIGTAAAEPSAQDEVYASLIAAYRQIIARIHAQAIPVFGATITPFGSYNSTLQPYSDPAGYREQTRSKVNAWIRDSGEFDAVVDFDAVVRDMQNTTMLAGRYDSGDQLHPNVAGYRAMAENFLVSVFEQWAGGINGYV